MVIPLHSLRLTLAAALLAAASSSAYAQASGPISPQRMSDEIKVLASDAFQGRAPGAPAEAKTIDFLVERFKAVGLQPGAADGSWTQDVPLVRTDISGAPDLKVTGLGAPIALAQNEAVYVSTVRPVDRVQIVSAPLVFVGYGVHAPERSWDDFKGVDLKGKIAVFLVNDPDFEASASDPAFGRFGGKAMTYYGRWTYKFEEAARRGAVGALIVHEAPAAGYGWSTVIAPQGEAYDVVRSSSDPQPVLMQGWMQHDAAVDLFRRAGLDYDALKAKARRTDFHPVPLGAARLSVDFPVRHERLESRNVLAKLTGAKRPDETIFYGAHWDAYGVGAPDAQGRTIRPGADDDGTGVAGELEIARAMAKGSKLDRTVVFAVWTAEERGLLGSEWYAQHPVYPVAKTVANLTMDTLQTAGPSHDVELVGGGQDSLEQDLAKAAAAQGRTVTPDAHPEKGLAYRADHFSFSKRGVPTLLLMEMGGGPDLLKGGKAAGAAWVAKFTAERYHKTGDAWWADWDLRGAAQDVDLLYRIGVKLADSDTWPSWNAGSEFAAARAQTAAERR